MNAVFYDFESGDRVEIVCTDFEETYRIKNNFSEGLGVVVRLKETLEWITNY